MRENRKEKKGRRQRGELEVRKEDRLGGRSKIGSKNEEKRGGSSKHRRLSCHTLSDTSK